MGLLILLTICLLFQSQYGSSIPNFILRRGDHSDIHPTQFKGQNFRDLQSEWQKKGKLFEDPAFNKQMALSLPQEMDNNETIINEVTDDDDYFMRPGDIVKHPAFFVDGPSRFDVIQGSLMDCWFASSMASLTLNHKLFRNVVPSDNSFQKNYQGIFHFRFWQYGSWVDVVVDDRLSVFYRQLDYIKSSDDNEFWSSLLEKAYAKIKGSYKALNGGEPEEALVDFTGGISLNIFLDQKNASDALFQQMKEASEANDLMTADIYPDDSWSPYETGLQQGHGYSITRVVEVDYVMNGTALKQKLIRVRNPYGSYEEWTGPWNEHSDEWKNVKESVRVALEVRQREDGEFWIPYLEFYKYFTILTIFHVPIPANLDGSQPQTDWKLLSLNGSFESSNLTYSLHNFPQHHITVQAPTSGGSSTNNTLFIGLMQKYRRENNLAMLPIGVSIYKLPENRVSSDRLHADFFASHEPIGTVEDPVNGMREVSDMFSVPPGNYCIVPYTFTLKNDTRISQSESFEYLLRVFSRK